LIKFELDSGREIELFAFNFSYTYAGFLAGIPEGHKNMEIFNRASYPTEWGDFKVLKIVPSKKELLAYLKPICYCAMLQSSSLNAGKDDFLGSALVVIWFGDEPQNRAIEEILKTDLEHIDWEGEAENYND
jgi:hypothetical protein